MEKEKRQAGLTVRQKKFVAGITEGKSQTQAAVDAGYSPSTAPQQGNRMLKKAHIREAITDILERKGLSDDYFADRLKDLCEAAGEKGPEWSARGRGVEILGKIRGHLDAKLRVTHEDVPQNPEEQAAQLLAIIHEIVPQLAPKVIEVE
jgi:hypothetical protein